MDTALTDQRFGRNRPLLRRRAGSLALAIAIEILLILGFVGLNYKPKPKDFEGGASLSTFDVAPPAETANRKAAANPKKSEPRAVRPVPKIVLPTRNPQRPEPALPIIEMSKKDLDAADISKLGSNSPDYQAKMADGSAGDSARVGTAPNGQPLYAAQWYREPTNRELSTYLPASMPEGGGAGLVACRTAPRFRVEDCVELGSDPPGSRLAGAVRQAAWQFLVRPPRVGGKDLIGEWVRIRIDYRPSR